MKKAPAFLQKDDQVALIAPAGYIENEESILLAEKLLKSWGLVPVRGKYVLEKHSYFAGTDEQRLEDFQNALDNPKIKAIWAIRGGYGSMRILPKLNFDTFKKHPKWIIGFSDITAIHNSIHKLGYKSLHAFMPIQLLDDDFSEEAIESLQNALMGESIENIVPASTYNKTGSAQGILIGGNLSIIESLIGTPYQLNTKGKILFLEETGESLYKIDRLLTSLKLAGYFKNLQTLVIGSFTDIKPDKSSDDINFQDLVLETVKEYDYPVIFDIPIGHTSDNQTLILGDLVTVNVGEYVSCVRYSY